MKELLKELPKIIEKETLSDAKFMSQCGWDVIQTEDVKDVLKKFDGDLDRLIEMTPHMVNVKSTIMEVKLRMNKRFGEGLC